MSEVINVVVQQERLYVAVVLPGQKGDPGDDADTEALEAETAARIAADAAEAATRSAGDTALDGRLDLLEAISFATDAELAAAIAGEAATRASADNGLDARLDTIEALGSLATDAELAAEAATRAAADSALDSRLDDVEANKADVADLADYIPLTQKGAASGVAELDSGGKVPVAQIPATAITDVFVVASQAAMLALAAEKGDIAIRSDLNKSFALSTNSPGTLADWKELLTPTDLVLSVAGRTGNVVLAIADVSGLQAALDGKASSLAELSDVDNDMTPGSRKVLIADADSFGARTLQVEDEHTDIRDVTWPIVIGHPGDGDALAAGAQILGARVPWTGKVIDWTLTGDVAATVTLDVKTAAYATWPTTTSIFGTKPSLAAARKNQATGLALDVVAGQLADIVLDANDAAKQLVLTLTIRRGA